MKSFFQNARRSIARHTKPCGIVLFCILMQFIFMAANRIIHHREKGGQNRSEDSVAGAGAARDLPGIVATSARTKSKDRGEGVASDPGQSLEVLKRMIENVMQEKEARRCRVLAEFSDETSDFTVVAVDPPDSGEISEIREKISSLMKSCRKPDREELDVYITKLLAQYDPFGSKGKRAFFVTISNGDAPSHASAMSFSVDSFDDLPEKLNPKSDVPYPLKNAHWYQNPDGGTLSRLKHIIR